MLGLPLARKLQEHRPKQAHGRSQILLKVIAEIALDGYAPSIAYVLQEVQDPAEIDGAQPREEAVVVRNV
jgi:hypothetical protein